MENPIEAFEHLPKNKKLIAVGGAITLGGILVYMHHKKQQAADTGANTDTADGTTSSGTADSGVQDDGSAAYDQYSSDEGILPYQDASDPYGSYYGSGGGGFGSAGGGYSSGVGAGDLNNGTATTMPLTVSETADPALVGVLGDIAAGLTGGGAPQTDPSKHMTGAIPRRGQGLKDPAHKKTTTTPHGTTQHKTNAPSPTNTRKAKTTKARPKGKAKRQRRTVGARMSF